MDGNLGALNTVGMVSKSSLLQNLEEIIEDLIIINDFYCENGEEGIVEMIPPVKYLLACISDILNYQLNNQPAGFYSCYQEISKISGPIKADWDEFDKGLIWIIQELNSNNLKRTIEQNYETIKFYYKQTSFLVLKKETFLELLAKLESSVKFFLHPEDLYTTRIRFKPKKLESKADHETNSPISTESTLESTETTGSDVFMNSSFISMEAIDVAFLQERELTNEFGFINKLKYNSLRFINNFRVSSKLKPHRSDFDFSVCEDDFESINIYSKQDEKEDSKGEESCLSFNLETMEICPEKGLIAQNYLCPECGNGISLNDSIKCDFSGLYTCPKCHGNEKCINPLRIVKNWDFQRYPISKKSKQIITNLSYNYLIKFPKINPKIFKSNEKFKNIQVLREKIVKSAQKRLKAAGKIDGPKQFALLEKIAWPKTHLLTSADLYTIEDLIEIENDKFYSSVLLPLYNLLKL